MKTKLMKLAGLALMASGSMFARTHVSFGITVGSYPSYYAPAPAYASQVPPCPGPDYVWLNGRWDRRPTQFREDRFYHSWRNEFDNARRNNHDRDYGRNDFRRFGR
jgi:hypothetical protein